MSNSGPIYKDILKRKNDYLVHICKILEKLIVSKPPGETPFVAIAGIPGSGKSTLSEELRKRLKMLTGRTALVVPMDGYHYYRKELDQMDDPEHAHARRGAPFTFNAQKFVDDVSEAKRNGHGMFPGFDHAKGDPEADKICFVKEIHDIVIVEGLYVLSEDEPWCQLQSQFDKTFYVDTYGEITIGCLIDRMINEMGLTEEEAFKRVENNDLKNADYVLDSIEGSKHYSVESFSHWTCLRNSSMSSNNSVRSMDTRCQRNSCITS